MLMPASLRSAGARRDDDPIRTNRFHLGHADLIVAADFNLRPQLSQILDEVVGERIVVVEHEDHSHLHSLSSLERAVEVLLELVPRLNQIH